MKELRKLDKQHARNILDDEDPKRFGEERRYELEGLWKYRVEEYRIICNIDETTITVLVLRVDHRRKIYRDAKR